MIITYHGHSCFKLKGKNGTVVTDPFNESVGLPLASLSADIVTVSHDHDDHNQISKVTGTARREKPFIIKHLGEYEAGGISVFGVKSYHDGEHGSERGTNHIYTIVVDEVRICHLGDLGHELTEEMANEIGSVDVLLIPVGGVYTINAKQAVAVVKAIEPSIIIPMHFKTSAHNPETYGEMQAVEEFIKEFGAEDLQTVDKLKIESERLPEEKELVILERT